jgi:Siphovirus Gp157
MTVRHLYDIPQEIEQFEQQLIENGGELTPELEQAWSAFVQSGKDKLEAAAFVLNRLKHDAETCRTEVRRLEKRALSTETNRKRLSELTLYALKALGGKIKTSLISMWTGRTAKQISVEVKAGADLAAVAATHPELVRVSYAANLEAVKKAYADIATKLEKEREALELQAARPENAGTLLETLEKIDAQMLERWKALLAEANLPDCFIVRHEPATEYLVIR